MSQSKNNKLIRRKSKKHKRSFRRRHLQRQLRVKTLKGGKSKRSYRQHRSRKGRTAAQMKEAAERRKKKEEKQVEAVREKKKELAKEAAAAARKRAEKKKEQEEKKEHALVVAKEKKLKEEKKEHALVVAKEKKLKEEKKEHEHAIVVAKEKAHEAKEEKLKAEKAEELAEKRKRAATKIQAIARAHAARKKSPIKEHHIKSVHAAVKSTTATHHAAQKWKKKAHLKAEASEKAETAIVLHNNAVNEAHEKETPKAKKTEKDAAKKAKAAKAKAAKAEAEAEKAKKAHDKAQNDEKKTKAFDIAYKKCMDAAKKMPSVACGAQLKKARFAMLKSCHPDQNQHHGKTATKAFGRFFSDGDDCFKVRKKCCAMSPGQRKDVCEREAEKECGGVVRRIAAHGTGKKHWGKLRSNVVGKKKTEEEEKKTEEEEKKTEEEEEKKTGKKTKAPELKSMLKKRKGKSCKTKKECEPDFCLIPTGEKEGSCVPEVVYKSHHAHSTGRQEEEKKKEEEKGCDPERVSTALCPQYKEVHHLEEKKCIKSPADLKKLAELYKAKKGKCRQERAISEIDTLVLQKSDGKYVPFEKIDVSPATIKLETHRGNVIETIAKTAVTGVHFKSGDRVEFTFKTRGGRRTRRRRTLRKNKRKTKKRGGKKKKKTRRRNSSSRHSKRTRRKKSRRRQRGGANGDIVIKYKPASAEKIETFKADLSKHGWKHLIGAKPVIAPPPPVVGKDIDQRATPVPPPPQITDPSAPQLPDPSAPQITDPSAPQLPDPSAPQLPDPSAPQLPDPSSPQLPDPSAPQLPDDPTMPAMPSTPGTTPATPGTTPAMPATPGTTPAMPATPGTTPATPGTTPSGPKKDDSDDNIPTAKPVWGGPCEEDEEAREAHRSNTCVREKDRTMIVKIVMPTEGGIERGSGGVTATRMREHVRDATQTTQPVSKKQASKTPTVKGTPVSN